MASKEFKYFLDGRAFWAEGKDSEGASGSSKSVRSLIWRTWDSTLQPQLFCFRSLQKVFQMPFGKENHQMSSPESITLAALSRLGSESAFMG